jgi:hypothetical protein
MINNALPIVFCHGLPGWGNDELCVCPYFVCVHDLKEIQGDELPPFLFPSTGPVSSLHDQVCELFFQLKGGLTDSSWVHSITSTAGVQNGTPFTWIPGAGTNTGILKHDVLTVQFLCMLVRIAGNVQNRNKSRRYIFDFHLDQWDFNNILQPAMLPHKYRKKEEMQFYANLVTHILRTRK